jgi:hypothetical protein
MLLTTGAVGALVLAGATACASTSKSVSVSSGGSYSSSPSVASASPSTSPSASASKSASMPASASPSTTSPTIAAGGGVGDTPNAQLTNAPSGTKYTPFQSAAHSADGRTLYLALESQGGACGQYDVVVQQSSSSVSVGLIHLSAGTRMCPQFITRMLVPAKLSAPLDGRRVIDLANGQTVVSAQIG